MHHGQICFSTERIIILESIADKFTQLLKDHGEGFAPGSGVSKEVVGTAHSRLVEAQHKGAKFILGGPKYTGPAELLPTIATGITKDMAMFDLESFGPSVSLYVVKDDNEAIAAANNSSFGLNASIHTTDMYRAVKIARRLEFGQVHVNASTAHNEGMNIWSQCFGSLLTCIATFPIGGTKGSGWGRNNSQFGIEEFVKLKTISLNMDNEAGTFGKG
jgi:acyl-CoA reductase-like NAD-dependent aldehyde dehydrogenase